MLRLRFINSILLIAASLPVSSFAEEIRGVVIIKQRLTHQRVTAAPSLYDRGPAVPLHADPQDDPLAAERARVVVYMEGPSSGYAPAAPIASIEQKDRRF